MRRGPQQIIPFFSLSDEEEARTMQALSAPAYRLLLYYSSTPFESQVFNTSPFEFSANEIAMYNQELLDANLCLMVDGCDVGELLSCRVDSCYRELSDNKTWVWTADNLKQIFGYNTWSMQKNRLAVFLDTWNYAIGTECYKLTKSSNTFYIPGPCYYNAAVYFCIHEPKSSSGPAFWKYKMSKGKNQITTCSSAIKRVETILGPKSQRLVYSKPKKLEPREKEPTPSSKKIKGGVYAIYKDNEVIYVGYTSRDFNTRFEEHRRIFAGLDPTPKGMIVYQLGSLPQDNITFKPLIRAEDIKCEELTARDIQAMELGFITALQPKGNYQGIKMDYVFQ